MNLRKMLDTCEIAKHPSTEKDVTNYMLSSQLLPAIIRNKRAN